MAIVDKNAQNWFNVDRDEDQFVGLQLPLVLDNGELASTKTTIEAVKHNLYNLCNTDAGERVMQPNLGVRLKRYLFEPFSEELVYNIQDTLTESINYWMPFLTINDIEISMGDGLVHEHRQTLTITVKFMLGQDESTLDSITYTTGNQGTL